MSYVLALLRDQPRRLSSKLESSPLTCYQRATRAFTTGMTVVALVTNPPTRRSARLVGSPGGLAAGRTRWAQHRRSERSASGQAAPRCRPTTEIRVLREGTHQLR